MEDRHLSSAVHILKNLHYFTIATVCEDGSPWATPVSGSLDAQLNLTWGSSPDNVHSQNIHRDGNAFVVIFDSNAPEGTGEGVYLRGRAEEAGKRNGSTHTYRFIPEQAWINDEQKNQDGRYMHDIRIELDLEALKRSM